MKPRSGPALVRATLLATITLIFLAPAQPAAAANFQEELKTFRELIGLVRDLDSLSRSESGAAQLALMSVEDHFDDPRETALFLEELLIDTEDAGIRASIRIKLLDLYKKTGRPEKARAHLRLLILQSRPGVSSGTQ